MTVFVVVMGATTLLATTPHALDAFIWAVAYLLLGALPVLKSAMFYSLNAITSYGHDDLFLEERLRLMGALEALNGWLLFGLTTAFLFGMIAPVWSSDKRYIWLTGQVVTNLAGHTTVFDCVRARDSSRSIQELARKLNPE